MELQPGFQIWLNHLTAVFQENIPPSAANFLRWRFEIIMIRKGNIIADSAYINLIHLAVLR